MNILVATLFSASGCGGLSSHISYLLDSLKTAGHSTKLIHYDLIEISRLHKFWNMCCAFGNKDHARKRIMQARIRRIAEVADRACTEDKYDLIHCHDPFAAYGVKTSKLASQLPLVQTIHGPLVLEAQMGLGRRLEESDYLSFLWDVENTSFHKAERIIAVDTGQANIAKEKFNIDSSKIDIIFNAVHCSEVVKTASETPKTDLPELYVLVPRRLVKKNGVDVAIRALALISDELDLKLLVAGWGVEYKNLSNLANELNIQDRVVFLGRQTRSEVIRLAKRAKAVLIPSKPAEIVKSGYNGLAVPPDDPAALAGAIKEIVTDTDLCKKISSQASQYARSSLDVGVWINKILQVYERARDTKNLC